MQGFVDVLRGVPAGVWTLLVALLGFLIAWGKDRQARQERELERRERHELRLAEEQKDRDHLALEEIRYWRDRHLVVLADFIGHGQELVNQCVLHGERVLTDEALVSLKEPLDAMTRQEPQVSLLCSRPVRDEVATCSLFAWQTYGDITTAHRSGSPLPAWKGWASFENLNDSLIRVLRLSTEEIRSPASGRPETDPG